MYVENRGELRRFISIRRLLSSLVIALSALIFCFQLVAHAQSDSHQVEITLEPLDEGYQLAIPNLMPPGPTTFSITNHTDVVQGFAVVGAAIEPFLIEEIEPGETVSVDLDLGEGIYLAYSPVRNYAALGMESAFFVTDERTNPATTDAQEDAGGDAEGDAAENGNTNAITGTETMTGTGIMTGTVVLRAGEHTLTQDEFNELFLHTLRNFAERTGLPVNPLTLPIFEELRQRLLDQLALQETLLAEAERRAIEVPEHQVDNMLMRAKQAFAGEEAFQQALEVAGYMDEAAFREAIRREATIELVIAELREEISVDDEEVRAFYAENQALFRIGPGAILPLEAVDERIRQALELKQLQEIVADLQAEAEVETFAGNLRPLWELLQQPSDASASVSDSSTLTQTQTITSTTTVTDMIPEAPDSAPITGTTPVTDTLSGLSDVRTATATMKNAEGEVIGIALFTQVDEGPVEIEMTIDQQDALRPGAHGLHIHTIGACSPDFEAAGDHVNPTRSQHGLENPDGPHAGDLPNLEISAEGTGEYRHQSDLITLGDGPTSLFDADGSALLIHAQADNQTSEPAGESGERVACGVIMPGTNSAADAKE